MDPGDSYRGIFRNGLGIAAGSARTPLFALQKMSRKGSHRVIELAILLLAVCVFWAFADWRLGLLLCLATAILQDPLRKLTPDQPVYFVGFVGVVFAAAFIGALVQRCANVTVQSIRRQSAARETYVDFAAVDYFGGVQFLRSVWQSGNFTDWIAHVFVAATRNCLRVSTCCSRRSERLFINL